MAAASVTIIACDKEVPSQIDESNEPLVEVTIIAGNPATKTEIEGLNPYWSVGDAIGVSNGSSTNYKFETDIQSRSATASFTGQTSVSSVLYAYYPYSSNGVGTNGAKVDIPSTQRPTASSFDGAADIMVAKEFTVDPESTTVEDLEFKRLGAIVKVVLKDKDGTMTGTQNLSSISLTAVSNLVGRVYIDMVNQELGGIYYGESKTVTAEYTSTTQFALNGTNAAYFVVYPQTIAEGSTLTVAAETEDYVISKDITVPTGGIVLEAGKITTLNINLLSSHINAASSGAALPFEDNMAWADNGSTESNTDISSSISSSENSNGLYISATKAYKGIGGLKLGSSSATGSITTKELDLSGAFYIAIEAGKYGSDTGSIVVSIDEDAAIINSNDFSSVLYANVAAGTYTNKSKVTIATSSKRAYVYSVNIKSGAFVPPVINVTSSNPMGVDNTNDLYAIEYTIDNPSSGESISASSNVSWIHDFDYSVDGEVSFEVDAQTAGAPARSGVITLSYTGAANVAVTVNQDAGAGATATSNWELVTDFSTIENGGKYIFVNVQGSTSYYMKSSTASVGDGTQCVALTNLPTDSGFVESDEMCVFLTGDTTNGFIVSNADGKELFIKNTNNGLGFLDSGTTVNFYTDTNVNGYTLRGYDNASTPVLRYVGMNSTTNFRCYTSVNNNVKTGEYVWYHYIGSGSSTSITWVLKSIAVATAPTKTTYTAGENFNPAGLVITATYEDAAGEAADKSVDITYSDANASSFSFSPSTSTALATSDESVTISYTEGGVTKTANQTITVNTAPVVTYDFETVADLNGLVTSSSSTYSGYLTDAVVSFVPATNTAIVKDATGSVMFYKSSHGLKQGQVFTGAIEVTAIKYNSLYSEVTVWDATFSGAETVVAPESVALADLIGHYDDYQNAYVQVAGLTVESVSGKNINVSDGTNNYVVYDNTSSVSVSAGEVITAVGTITKYQTTEEIKVWKASDVTVTASLPKAVNFTQPSGGSFTVSVGGSSITSGTTVAAGTTVTLAATPASGYNFSGWNVTGASVADASAASTSFEMGSSPVSISATFTQAGSTTHYYVKVTSTTSITDGDYLIVYESDNVAFDGGLNSFDAVGNTIGVTITSNGIEATSSVNAAKFTINSMSGGYSIMGASGKYITVNSYSNGLATSASAAANGIAFDANGNALITVSTSGGTMTLKYNSASNQTRFRYYKSGQQNIQLYKLN